MLNSERSPKFWTVCSVKDWRNKQVDWKNKCDWSVEDHCSQSPGLNLSLTLSLTITMDHSFLRHTEFWAKPQNLPVTTEFLCFRGILRNSVLASNKGDKYGTLWSFSGGHTVCIHDFAMKYMTADWAVMERMLKLLIWAYLKYSKFIW